MNQPNEARTTWLRVSRSHPYPVCGHHDWCLIARDGGASICPCVESATRAGNAGFLHRLTDRQAPHRDHTFRITSRKSLPNLEALAGLAAN